MLVNIASRTVIITARNLFTVVLDFMLILLEGTYVRSWVTTSGILSSLNYANLRVMSSFFFITSPNWRIHSIFINFYFENFSHRLHTSEKIHDFA